MMFLLLSLLGIAAIGAAVVSVSEDEDSESQAEPSHEDIRETELTEIQSTANPGTLIQGSDSADTLTGNALNDIVFGNKGNDLISGGGENDLLVDIEGQDTIDGDSGNDLILSAGILDVDQLQHEVLHYNGEISDAVNTPITTDTDTEGDVVNGGTGHDTMFLGQGDTATGGLGRDEFVTGQWLEGREAVVIEDYDSSDDSIFYLNEHRSDMNLEVGFENDDAPDDAYVRNNGQLVMIVRGAGTEFGLSNIYVVTND
jgi:Ca2+-binding RTX toxin-like protein